MFTVSKTSKTRPAGARNGGRTESTKWAGVAAQIAKQAPGEWIVYKEMEGTKDALALGTRLRSKAPFEDGKAFAPLKGKVAVALTNVQKDKDGKAVSAVLAIQYNPKGSPKRATKVTETVTETPAK